MTTPPPARRRRRRASAPQGEPAKPAVPAPEPEPAPAARTKPRHKAARQAPTVQVPAKQAPATQAPEKKSPARPAASRKPPGTRDLAAQGGSQVGLSAALRARAVNRPTDEDLAAAEREVEIVRRDWHPPA